MRSIELGTWRRHSVHQALIGTRVSSFTFASGQRGYVSLLLARGGRHCYARRAIHGALVRISSLFFTGRPRSYEFLATTGPVPD